MNSHWFPRLNTNLKCPQQCPVENIPTGKLHRFGDFKNPKHSSSPRLGIHSTSANCKWWFTDNRLWVVIDIVLQQFLWATVSITSWIHCLMYLSYQLLPNLFHKMWSFFPFEGIIECNYVSQVCCLCQDLFISRRARRGGGRGGSTPYPNFRPIFCALLILLPGKSIEISWTISFTVSFCLKIVPCFWKPPLPSKILRCAPDQLNKSVFQCYFQLGDHHHAAYKLLDSS